MGYYAHWQPLVDENAHTVLTFGFLRHAPPDSALNPWLSEVLQRAVTCQGLQADAFWPRYRSTVGGSVSTEPEVVFWARDSEPLLVVIEVKPWYGQHAIGQLRREAVDTV
ncbi:MAG: hypothetical protein LC713_03075, partial [Actinobacteria bacterium]|nr:hypothetical protein [Actinomycetota bacterium]